MDLHLARHPSARALALRDAFEALPLAEIAPDLCLVLGGDGTMLAAIHERGRHRRYLGINCGNLGFLMNDAAGEPPEVAREVLDRIAAGELQERAFPCLRVQWEPTADDPPAAPGDPASLPAGDPAPTREHAGDPPAAPAAMPEDFAINDACLTRASGQTCHLRVEVDGVEVVSRLICDGLIAATPLGSTAYSFSAGGPAAHPALDALHLTAICPHLPRLPPMVLPPRTRVTVEARYPDHRPAHLSVDGADRGPARRMLISTDAARLRLCHLPGHDLTATLIRKIVAV